MNWSVTRIDKMVQALQRRKFRVDQGDPKHAFPPAGTNDEIEISFVPCEVCPLGNEEGNGPWKHRPQEDGSSVRDQDQTLGQRLTVCTDAKDGLVQQRTTDVVTRTWYQTCSTWKMEMGTPETSVQIVGQTITVDQVGQIIQCGASTTTQRMAPESPRRGIVGSNKWCAGSVLWPHKKKPGGLRKTSGGSLEEDVQKLFRDKEDGEVEVHKWITEVPCDAKACKEGRREEEDLPDCNKDKTR